MTPEQYQAIAKIGAIPTTEVAAFKDGLRCLSGMPTPAEIFNVANSAISEVDSAATISESLLSIFHVSSRRDVDVSELLEEYGESVSSNEAIKDGLKVIQMFEDVQQLARTSKALELIYDRDNLLQRTRIMTDIRPLFSRDATSVDGCAISHTLRVSYDSGGTSQELSLAIDEDDLNLLMQNCSRALLKAKTAREKICDEAGLPSLGQGDE